VSTNPNAVSPLRRRMIEDMTIRRFTEKTQGDYIRYVRAFAAFLGRSPELAEPEDLRRFQRHMAAGGARPATMNAAVSALRFFFQITLGRAGFGACLAATPSPERLPVVLSTDEVARLLRCAPGLKYQAALSIAYGCGLRVSEIIHLKVVDIDSARMLIRVEQGKGPQGPLRDAVAGPARHPAGLVEREAAARLAVPGPAAVRSPHGAPAQPRGPRRRDAAGLNKRGSMHTLRHSFATHLLERKTDIRVIQVLLGQRKLDTTGLYTRVALNMIQAVESPLAHLRPKAPPA